MSAVLSIEGLVSGYGRSRVLHGVDLEVRAGEVVCVMGRNGVGKTTLLRTVMGILPATAGRIDWDGRDIGGWKPYRIHRAGLAWVPQDEAVYPGLTVAEHLTLAGGDGRALGRAFDLFPALEERIEQAAHTLSGGERKMLSIAQALVSEPRMLLLDEPTEGVAPSVVQMLIPALARVAHSCSLLLVEQNVDTALALGGRAYVLEKGAVIEEGDIRVLHDEGILHQRLGL